MGESFIILSFFFFFKMNTNTFKWERKDTLHKEKLISSEIEYHLTSKAAVQITVALLPGL